MTRGGWKDEDLHFRLVDSPPSYAYTTDGPVRYAVVANDNGVLGYLWASNRAVLPVMTRSTQRSPGSRTCDR
jgi:hypothetical protein